MVPMLLGLFVLSVIGMNGSHQGLNGGSVLTMGNTPKQPVTIEIDEAP